MNGRMTEGQMLTASLRDLGIFSRVCRRRGFLSGNWKLRKLDVGNQYVN